MSDAPIVQATDDPAHYTLSFPTPFWYTMDVFRAARELFPNRHVMNVTQVDPTKWLVEVQDA